MLPKSEIVFTVVPLPLSLSPSLGRLLYRLFKMLCKTLEVRNQVIFKFVMLVFSLFISRRSLTKTDANLQLILIESHVRNGIITEALDNIPA